MQVVFAYAIPLPNRIQGRVVVSVNPNTRMFSWFNLIAVNPQEALEVQVLLGKCCSHFLNIVNLSICQCRCSTIKTTY